MPRRRDLAARLPGTPTLQTGVYFYDTAQQIERLGPKVATGLYLGPSREIRDEPEGENLAETGSTGTESLPLNVDLFGGRTRRMIVVSETDLGRLMALRAAACGAAVIVVTTDRARWLSMFGQEVPAQFHVLGPSDQSPQVPGEQPLLFIVDRVSPRNLTVTPPGNQRSEVWFADTSLLADYEELFEDTDVVGYGRTRPDVVNQAIEMGRAPSPLATVIENLAYHQLVLRTRNTQRVVDLITTPAEAALLGSADPVATDEVGQPASRQQHQEGTGTPQGDLSADGRGLG